MKQNSSKSSHGNTPGRRISRISSSLAEDEDDDNDDDNDNDNNNHNIFGSREDADQFVDTNAVPGISMYPEWTNGGPGVVSPTGSYAYMGFDTEAFAASIAKDQVQYEAVAGTGLWGLCDTNAKDIPSSGRKAFDWEDEIRKTGKWLAMSLDGNSREGNGDDETG